MASAFRIGGSPVGRQRASRNHVARDDQRDRALRSVAVEKALGERCERHGVDAAREAPPSAQALAVGQRICECGAVACHCGVPDVGCRARVCGRLVSRITKDEIAAVGFGQHRREGDVLQQLKPGLRIEPSMGGRAVFGVPAAGAIRAAGGRHAA